MTLDVFVFFVPFDYKVDETKEESMRNYGHAVNQSTVGLCLTPLWKEPFNVEDFSIVLSPSVRSCTLIMDDEDVTSNYRQDGKSASGFTKHKATCKEYSAKSLACLLQNDGEKENCSSKGWRITHTNSTSGSSSKLINTTLLIYYPLAAFFEAYRDCKVRAHKNRFKKKVVAPAVAAQAVAVSPVAAPAVATQAKVPTSAWISKFYRIPY